jgi:hypothetical protein
MFIESITRTRIQTPENTFETEIPVQVCEDLEWVITNAFRYAEANGQTMHGEAVNVAAWLMRISPNNAKSFVNSIIEDIKR